MAQTNRKPAPFLKDQPHEPFSEQIILAGSKAWSAWGKDGKSEDWRMLCDMLRHPYSQKPVILGDSQLAEIDRLQLVNPEQRFVRICQFGGLSEAQKMAICHNLAKNTQAERLIFADNVGQTHENASDYLTRLRQDDTAAKTVAHANRPRVAIDFQSEKPTQREIAEAFLSWHAQPMGRDVQQAKTLEYNGQFWQEMNDETLTRRVMQFFEEMEGDYTLTKLCNVAKLVQMKADVIPAQNTDFIGFQNGILNKKTGEFLPHHITHYLRGIEKFNCNTDNEFTPHFDDWLAFISNGDTAKRDAILAGLYMVLTNRHEWGLFLEATGTAGAGKSVMAQIAAMINGSNNTTAITLERLEEPKGNARAMLIGKSFAYAPDQAQFRGTADTLKAITGGDPVTVKPLYVDEFSVRLDLVYMIVTNHPLQFIDRNGAILRRRVIIEFDRAIPKEKKDVLFIEKVQGEIFGIVKALLARFPNPEEARLILENYRDSENGNHVRSSASHLVDFVGHFKLKEERKGALRIGSGRDNYQMINQCETFYSAYTFYCECHGLKRLNLRTFKEALPDAFKQAGEKIPYSDKIYYGYPTTNAFWKHKDLTLRQWEG